MDKKDFESLLNKYPDCVSDGKKLKAFLKDLFPDVPKAIVNTLTIMADDGIISEMKTSPESSSLVSARLQKKLEDDYGLSQKIISECFSLIPNNAKQTKSTISAYTHEKITGVIDAQPKFAPRKEGSQKLDILQPKYDPKDFEIVKGVLKKYKGRSSVVVIPNSVTSIGDWAFSGCSGLTSVTIGGSVTSIGDCAFDGCTGLTSITIPDSVTSIGGSAFDGCTGLTSITIGDSVTSIGEDAFVGCTGLTTVNWNATECTSAGSHHDPIFEGCSNLATVNIGDNVKIIPSDAFYNCTELTSITVAKGNTKYHSAGNCLIETESKTLIVGCKNSIIPTDGSVTSIGSHAFYNCTGLTSVTIPDSVTSIGSSAFLYCYRLIEVHNKSTLSITAGSFLDGYVADYAKNVYTNEGESKLTTDENGYVIYTDEDEKILIAYHGTNTELILPLDITKIYQYAFCGCTGLTSVTIGGSVTSIGDWAFSGCSGLTSITIPDSVTSIGSYAFFGCTGLTSVTIPDSVTSIGSFVFYGCTGLTSVTIGGSVRSIDEKAFFGCKRLTSVTIPDSVTSIGNEAFRGCTRLTSVTIGGSVWRIGDGAFYNCTGLTSVTIPDSVMRIGEGAFYGGRNLTIYCEAESKPFGWSSYWNPRNSPVVWGFKN